MYAEPTVSEALCALTGRTHAILTGRGATAIYLALRAAGLRDERVALPGNICPAAVCPVLYSGNVPVFFDINLTDFGLDLDNLQKTLREGAAAIIVPHSYGHVAPMQEIARLCSAAGAFLIEDAAPALGSTPDGAPAGSHGDCSVLSFGYAKIVDAGGGGALLTDDPALCREAQRLEGELPEWSPEIGRRAGDMAHLVRGWWNARRTEPNLDADLQPVWSHYRDVHLYRLSPMIAARICEELGHLPELVEARRAHFAEYQAAFADSPFLRPQPRPGSICWRYTFLAEAPLRDRLVEVLREDGLDVSTLYPAAHRQFETPVQADLPNCDRLDRTVVNLWVSPPLSTADIRRNARAVLEAVDGLSD